MKSIMQRIGSIRFAMALGSLGMLFATGAHAATATDSFSVTATVADACSVSASDLDFGAYAPLAGLEVLGTSAVTVTCTLLTGYTIKLGAGGSGDISQREMGGPGASTMLYNLYLDALRTTIWGSTESVDVVTGAGTGLPVPHTVYGAIPGGQQGSLAAGSYLDTIQVTLEY